MIKREELDMEELNKMSEAQKNLFFWGGVQS